MTAACSAEARGTFSYRGYVSFCICISHYPSQQLAVVRYAFGVRCLSHVGALETVPTPQRHFREETNFATQNIIP